MREFRLRFTGDMRDAAGNPIGDLALDLLDAVPHVRAAFLVDRQLEADGAGGQDRRYALEVLPCHVAAADGIVVCRPWVKASAFTCGAADLVAVGRAGIGFDKIDLAACTANDVVVFNAPHGLTHSTASAAMLFILALSKRLPLQQRLVREHRWDLQAQAIGRDLAGQTLGLVGLGKTAQELVRLLAPFHMRVIAYSPHASSEQARQLDVTLVDTLEELLRSSDYVSLHGRLEERTRKLIGERELALMKPTAFLVNVARGEMVDEEALARFLREHRIAGAGLDVFEEEPLPRSSPLLALDNVMLTPHWLASTAEAGRATMESVMGGMVRVACGKLPSNVLNPEVLDRPGFRSKLERYRA
jgi:phosphoglycerate dehydrogenase-like enzyme